MQDHTHYYRTYERTYVVIKGAWSKISARYAHVIIYYTSTYLSKFLEPPLIPTTCVQYITHYTCTTLIYLMATFLRLQNNNHRNMINIHNAQLTLTITGCSHMHDTYTFSDALYMNIYRLTSIKLIIAYTGTDTLDIQITPPPPPANFNLTE